MEIGKAVQLGYSGIFLLHKSWKKTYYSFYDFTRLLNMCLIYAHPDNMVFYHGGGGEHQGSYCGVAYGGKYGCRVKIVDRNTYLPGEKDGATIIYNEDW